MDKNGSENPWKIQSIYDFQYFNCPSCDFRNHAKQGFVDHVHEIHPDSIQHLLNVKDNSLADVVFPNIKDVIKEEVIVEEFSIDPIKLENQGFSRTEIETPNDGDNKYLIIKESVKKQNDKNEIEDGSDRKEFESVNEGTKHHKDNFEIVHEGLVQNVEFKSVMCNICCKIFDKMHDWQNHIETVHENYVNLDQKVDKKSQTPIKD